MYGGVRSRRCKFGVYREVRWIKFVIAEGRIDVNVWKVRSDYTTMTNWYSALPRSGRSKHCCWLRSASKAIKRTLATALVLSENSISYIPRQQLNLHACHARANKFMTVEHGAGKNRMDVPMEGRHTRHPHSRRFRSLNAIILSSIHSPSRVSHCILPDTAPNDHGVKSHEEVDRWRNSTRYI